MRSDTTPILFVVFMKKNETSICFVCQYLGASVLKFEWFDFKCSFGLKPETILQWIVF